MLDGEEGSVVLTGVIDAIEVNRPSPGDMTVVDFKTGKAKTRNDLLGKTKSGNGDYYRQIIFYAFLLQENGRDVPKQGIIEFVEQTEKGEYKKEIFDINQDEISKLEEIIDETISDIYSGVFLKTPPDEDHQYYALWSALQER